MLSARLLFCASLLLSLAAFPASPALAGEPTQAERETARTKGEEGLKLFGAEKYAEALEKFDAAYAAVPAPSLKLYKARCLRKIGKLLEARDLYEQIVLEGLPKDAPAAYTQAQGEAKTELETLRKRIPVVQIVASGVPPESIRAAVDGRSVPILKERIELNPGDHAIDVFSTRAASPARKLITLAEGATERIEFELSPDGQATLDEKPASTTVSTPVSKTPPKRIEAGSLIPSLAVLGMGAANLGIGVVMGIMSKAQVDDIKSRCVDGVCKPEEQPAADAARTMGDIATVNIALGVLGVAGGTTLLLLRDGSPKKPAKSGVIDSFSIAVGPGSLGFSGAF